MLESKKGKGVCTWIHVIAWSIEYIHINTLLNELTQNIYQIITRGTNLLVRK